MKHIFTAIVLTFALFATILFSTAAIFAYYYGQKGHSSLPETGAFAHLNTDPAAITALATLATTSLSALALSLFIDRLNPSTSTTKWLANGIRRWKTARLIIGLVLVISSIAFSENIQGDNPAKDLGCAAICLLGLYLGFRSIGLSELRRRGC